VSECKVCKAEVEPLRELSLGPFCSVHCRRIWMNSPKTRARSIALRLRRAEPASDIGEAVVERAARIALDALAQAIEDELENGPLIEVP
jgi:endogenous inhibitor of DNA gyrase (YacG/DUF329 family)